MHSQSKILEFIINMSEQWKLLRRVLAEGFTKKENGRKLWWMCKRKCTTGDKLHQSHCQEHRPCVMHVLPPRRYYYLGIQPGVMVCQLFPCCLYWQPPPAPWHHAGTLGEHVATCVVSKSRDEERTCLLVNSAWLTLDEYTQIKPPIRHKLHLKAGCSWY